MANVNLIKTSINDACRYARNSDPRVVQSAGTFLREGKKIPQASMLYMADAQGKSQKYIADNCGLSVRALVKGSYTFLKNLIKAMKCPANKQDYKAFDKEFKTLYPKTAHARKKIMIAQGRKASESAFNA